MPEENKSKAAWVNIGMTVTLFVFLLTVATFLVLAVKPLYYGMIHWFHIDETSGYDVNTIKANYDSLISYNMFWGPKKLVFYSFPMSREAEIHFSEVKNIFVGMQIAATVSGLLLIPGCIYCKKKKITAWPKACLIAMVAVLVIVGTGLAFFWEKTFILFHEIVFNNDYWMFSPVTDPVINILPDEVFLTDAACILGLIAFGLVLFNLAFRKKK